MENRKRVLVFIFSGLISIILYFLTLGIYTRITDDPIIFVISVVLAVIIPIVICIVLSKLWGGGKKKEKEAIFNSFTITIMGIVYAMGIILVAVFGPTFIDRSISYHIAFYAVEEEKIYIQDIQDEFSTEIFDKRIHDAVMTGFIEKQDDGSYTPTIKAKIMTMILTPIGHITDSLNTYQEMKKKIKSE